MGGELAVVTLEHLTKQMAVFKERLEEFAVKHKSQINKNPEFRAMFQSMTASVGTRPRPRPSHVPHARAHAAAVRMEQHAGGCVGGEGRVGDGAGLQVWVRKWCGGLLAGVLRRCAGVDPLASNKGFWAELLGVGNFYFELGVQIVDVCMTTRSANGGLIEMQVRVGGTLPPPSRARVCQLGLPRHGWAGVLGFFGGRGGGARVVLCTAGRPQLCSRARAPVRAAAVVGHVCGRTSCTD